MPLQYIQTNYNIISILPNNTILTSTKYSPIYLSFPFSPSIYLFLPLPSSPFLPLPLPSSPLKKKVEKILQQKLGNDKSFLCEYESFFFVALFFFQKLDLNFQFWLILELYPDCNFAWTTVLMSLCVFKFDNYLLNNWINETWIYLSTDFLILFLLKNKYRIFQSYSNKLLEN